MAKIKLGRNSEDEMCVSYSIRCLAKLISRVIWKMECAISFGTVAIFYVVPLNYMSCHLILDRLLSSIRYVFIYSCNIFQY